MFSDCGSRIGYCESTLGKGRVYMNCAICGREGEYYPHESNICDYCLEILDDYGVFIEKIREASRKLGS